MISYFYLDSNFLIYLCQTVEKPTNHMIKCKFIAEETFIKVKKDIGKIFDTDYKRMYQLSQY